MAEKIAIQDRRELRGVIKRSLRSDPRIEYGRSWPRWVEKRILALIAWGAVNKSQLNKISLECVRLQFVEGWPVKLIAEKFHISPADVLNRVRGILDYVIDNTGSEIKKELVPLWRLKACPHCGGDLRWDAEGTIGDGDYTCILCSRRFDAFGEPRRLEK